MVKVKSKGRRMPRISIAPEDRVDTVKCVWGAALCIAWGIDPASYATPWLIKCLSELLGFDPEERVSVREAEELLDDAVTYLFNAAGPSNVGLVM